MSAGKIKARYVELAIYLAVPPLMIAAMILAGFVYVHKQDGILAQRTSLMNVIPVLEHQVSAAHHALSPYVAMAGLKDMSADLSLTVSDAAQKFGFMVRSSTVEKLAGAGTWTDYKLTLSGDGTLTSLIAMLDYLGHPQRRFNAVQVITATTRLTPETAVSADVVLVARVMAGKNGEAGSVGSTALLTPVMAEKLGIEVGKAAERAKSWATATVTPLSLATLRNRAPFVPPDPVQEQTESQVSFRLTGVVQDKRSPMIMTDKGVFGIGDEVEGYTIQTIGEDKVTVVNRGGRQEIVRLYRSGGGL